MIILVALVCSQSIPRPALLPLLHHPPLLLELADGPGPVGVADAGGGGELGAGVVAVDVLEFLGSRNRLIEGEVDLVLLVDLAVADLGHRAAEGLEIVDHRLVDEDIAVGEVEDTLPRVGLPQTPDDLEGGAGLACRSP